MKCTEYGPDSQYILSMVKLRSFSMSSNPAAFPEYNWQRKKVLWDWTKDYIEKHTIVDVTSQVNATKLFSYKDPK